MLAMGYELSVLEIDSNKSHCLNAALGWKRSFHKIIAGFVALSMSPWLAANALAQPLSINVLDAQYSTLVSATYPFGTDFTNVSSLTVSSSPTTDLLTLNDPSPPFLVGGSSAANSGWFGVEAYSAIFGGSGGSSATNQITFAPMTDQTQSLDLLFSSDWRYYFSSGSVRLFDLTASTELWNYYWDGSTSGNVPWAWVVIGSTASAELNLETDFYASHVYELTMNTSVGSASDTVQAQIQLLGLQAIVPEPSSIALLLMALPALFAIRRRIRP